MSTADRPKSETRYVSAAETAKLIRVELKKAFPRVRFSVRTKTYSTGASIDISWTDGPTSKRVDAVVSLFDGHGFDGMIDMQYYIDAWVLGGQVIGTCSRGTVGSRGSVPAWGLIPPHDDAERVHFGCSIHTHRTISAELANRCIALVAEYWGDVPRPLPVAVPGNFGFTIADGRGRERVRADLSHMHDWYTLIHQAAEDRSRFVRRPAELDDVDRAR
jgi:hypothetical protein